MEQILKVGRVVAMVILPAAIGPAIWALLEQSSLFVIFAFLAHLSLCFFICTEAFGPIAALRSRSSRVVARLILIPSGAAVLGTGYYLVMVGVS